MERKCFLCCSDTEIHFVQNLCLPGLAAHDIGFSICPECGLVLESPTVSFSDMQKYYSTTAVYINPGTKGRPSASKQQHIARHLQYIQSIVGEIPSSVFQVGCSDGYTLSALQNAGASFVTGIDPSIASNKLAAELYDIETLVGVFEDFVPDRQYELIVLTHILEHLYNPLEALAKCGTMQEKDDWIFVEVPLLERIDKLPPGYFAFEHLNYFSEITLLNTLSRIGYSPYSITKLYYATNYPIISIVAKKGDLNNNHLFHSDYTRAHSLMKKYWQLEQERWKQIEKNLRFKVKENASVYIWGAGIHTSQLFAFTNLRSHLPITGLLDSSSTKWGKQIGDLRCYDPRNIELKKSDVIIISSYASADELYESLAAYRDKGVTVKRLHGSNKERCKRKKKMTAVIKG